MAPRFPETYLNQWTLGIVCIAIIAVIVLLSVTGILPSSSCPVTVCSTDCSPDLGPVPIFTSPAEKIAALKDPAFTGKHYAEARATEPLLGTDGTRVHLQFHPIVRYGMKGHRRTIISRPIPGFSMSTGTSGLLPSTGQS